MIEGSRKEIISSLNYSRIYYVFFLVDFRSFRMKITPCSIQNIRKYLEDDEFATC